MIQWAKRHHKKIREIGTGLFLYESFNFVYDFLFYPFAIAYWGLALGGAIVVIGSLVQNSIMFWLYDYMSVDWLGAHALRQLDDKENKSSVEKLITWIGKKKVTFWEKLFSPVVFVGLTLPIDPLIVAIHYRKEHFKGVAWRDWGILFGAVFAANAWWLVKIGIIVESFKLIYTYILGS
jgi:hypothetical protein